MTVKAKFYVAEINKYATAVGRTQGWAEPVPFGQVTLRPSLKGEDNKQWASSTPAGEMKMTVNGPAFPWFESMLGKDILITMVAYPEEPVVSATG